MLYGIAVRHCENSEDVAYSETFQSQQEFQKVADNLDSEPASDKMDSLWIFSLFIPQRIATINNFCEDLFSPTLNFVSRTHSYGIQRIFLCSLAFTVDILTLPIRIIMSIPCFIYGETMEHPFTKYLVSKRHHIYTDSPYVQRVRVEGNRIDFNNLDKLKGCDYIGMTVYLNIAAALDDTGIRDIRCNSKNGLSSIQTSYEKKMA